MRLLSLTLEGFKSFAQPTTIEFRPGMTGIIGPNGSGKSNIIEAIRWVLGEQSAKTLRGDKMADVIFNGSAERAPLNRALVSIVFDNSDHYLNSDFTELKITRKLYRNGDSEYLINNQAVRLKDIVDLFIDSGVGRESFSVISQGQIAEIFNGKPADRRAIIEAAAGVSKYKQSKVTAEKRLTTTQENLNRVNDIVTELAGQLEPLAEQSALAKDYLEQKGKFDLLDKTKTVRQIEQDQRALQKLAAKQEQSQSQLKQYDQQSQTVSTALTACQRQQQVLSTTKDELQQKLLTTTTTINKLNNQQSLSSIRQEQQANDQKRLRNQLTQLEEQLNDNQQAIEEQTATLKKQQQEIANHQAALDEAATQSTEQRVQQLNTRLEKMQARQVELSQQQVTAQSQQKFLRQNQEQALAQYQQHSTALEKLKKQLATVKQDVARQTTIVEQADQQVQKLTRQVEEESAQYHQLQKQYEQTQQNWYQALGDVRSSQNRVKNYQEMAADYTGYYNGVQSILKHRQQFKGLYGPVSELIKVSPKYTLALETALGSQLQQLVVATQNDGKQIINYLVRQRGGRATLLPLDTLRSARQPRVIAELQEMPGFIGLAGELIQYDEHFQLVVDHLLSNTIVADNLDHATLISRAGRHQVRVVTLDGQVVNASGAMTGGANRHQRVGLLSQQQIIKKMQHELQAQQQTASELEQKVARLEKSRQANQQTLDDLQSQLTLARQRQNAMRKDQQVVINQQTMIQQRLASLSAQATATGDPQTIAQQLANAERKEQEATAELATLADQIKQLKQQQTAVHTNANAQLEQLHATRQWLAVADERKRQTDQRLQELQQQRQALLKLQQQVQDQLHNLQQTAQSQEDDQQSTVEALEQAKQRLMTVRQRLKDNEQKLAAANDQLQHLNEQNDRLQGLQRVAIEEAAGVKGNKARVESRLDQNLNHLSENYAMTLADARQNLSPLEDDELNRQLKLLKRGLNELGPVNTGAIQEYERVVKRYDFLTGQKEDLETARDQLQETMKVMDDQVKTRFVKTFNQVSAAFATTFNEIFAGGQAKLILTDPDNLLTSGVDIMAQPPGKRNQQLSLLSGGEQALTAIALLFAIIKVRPVPFAILDEPEAALDEVNVERFAKYLSNFGEDGPQFIVITHRKGTMMNANVLYGVTMQESGVSKMVSIDVKEALQE